MYIYIYIYRETRKQCKQLKISTAISQCNLAFGIMCAHATSTRRDRHE